MHRFRLTAVCIGVLIMPQIQAAGQLSPEQDKLLLELISGWDEQRALVESAEITYRRISRAPKGVDSISRDDALELFKTARFQDSPELILELALELDPTLPNAEALEEVLISGKYVAEGDSSKQDTTFLGNTESHSADSQSHTVTDRSSGLITVHSRGHSGVKTAKLTDFQWLPPQAFATGIGDLIALPDGRIKLVKLADGLRSELVVDGKTGFVHQSTVTNADRSFFQDIFQFFEWVDPSSGARFPRAAFRGTFVRGKLFSFELMYIDDIVINRALPDTAFEIPFSEGEVLVDRRKGRNTVLHAESSGADVKDALNAFSGL